MCPYCNSLKFKKKGFFKKMTTSAERIQRYLCHECMRSFSDQTGRLTYREKKPHENQRLYRLLCSGVSQTRSAAILGIHRITVTRKLERLARFARAEHRKWILTRAAHQKPANTLIFDEMETFEHTKCKPISLAIGVCESTRELISLHAATMPAKGLIASLSRKRYGRRKDLRPFALRKLMEDFRTFDHACRHLKSDSKTSYKRYVKNYFTESQYTREKGRRGATVGQGELKAIAFDPLFKLNHTCAMVRDNVKTMSRRTWCTVKRLDRLQDLLDLYVHFHNRFVVAKIRVPTICGDPAM